MRIISGTLKGRKILAPKNLPVRPTTDFAKEALFNILRNQVDLSGLKVIDLFAGTGNMSLEFISRGAESCLSVEQNSACVRFIHKTAQSFGLTNLMCMRMDVFKFLKRPAHAYDLIFADPPYDLAKMNELPDLVLGRSWLKPGGLFVLEHSKNNDFQEHNKFLFSKRYGNVNFTVFEQEINE